MISLAFSSCARSRITGLVTSFSVLVLRLQRLRELRGHHHRGRELKYCFEATIVIKPPKFLPSLTAAHFLVKYTLVDLKYSKVQSFSLSNYSTSLLRCFWFAVVISRSFRKHPKTKESACRLRCRKEGTQLRAHVPASLSFCLFLRLSRCFYSEASIYLWALCFRLSPSSDAIEGLFGFNFLLSGISLFIFAFPVSCIEKSSSLFPRLWTLGDTVLRIQYMFISTHLPRVNICKYGERYTKIKFVGVFPNDH